LRPPPTKEELLAKRSIFDSYTKKFLEQWAETYPSRPISLVLTGGGLSFLEIGKLPGASTVLASAHVPYHMLDGIAYTNFAIAEGQDHPLVNGDFGFCSAEATELYSKALEIRSKGIPGTVQVSVNASLTTTRWRRGLNEAWIWIRNHPLHELSVLRFRYNIAKYSEEEYKNMSEEQVSWARQIEDIGIACMIMSCLTSDSNYKDSNYKFDITGEWLEKVDNVANA